MNSIEDGLFGARQADLEANTPGRIGLNAALDEQDRIKRAESDAKADEDWRKAPPQENFNHREAHRQGVDLVNGDRPNQFVTPGTVNVAGHDLATGTKVKSVVSTAYEGAAYYGASQLQRSRTVVGGQTPPQDIMGLTAVAASVQAKGDTYEDFARAYPRWSDDQLAASWNAGTDVLRQQEIQKRDGWGPTVGLYTPSPLHLDFDVRMADKDFQQVGRRLYQHFHGTKFPDTDIEAARWLADHMRNLDFSTPMMAAIMLKGKSAGPEVHKDYIRAIEAWSLTNMERKWMPQLGNFARILFDPFNLAGASIGKMTLVTAGRAAALDFFKRMAVGAAGGAASGVIQATVSESVQGRIATGEQQVAAAVVPGVMAATGAGLIPEALALAGKGIKRGAQAFRAPGMPALRSNNVHPEGAALEGEYIPAGSGAYGEITLPNRAGDQPVRTTPEPLQLEDRSASASVEGEQPAGMTWREPTDPAEREAILEQQPYESDPVAYEGGGPPYPGTTIHGTYYPPIAEIERTMREHGIPHEDALDMLRQEHAAEPPEGRGMGPAMDPDADTTSLPGQNPPMLEAWITEHPYYGRVLEERVRSEMAAGAITPETRGYLEETSEGRAILAAGPQAWGKMPPPPPPPVELPPLVAPPPLPRDPNSRVLVDPTTGYYSPIQKIVAEHSMPAQLGKDWLGSVVSIDRRTGAKTGKTDVRLDEVAATGLEEWLTQPANYGRKIPREEVLDFLDKNLVKIQRYPLIPQVRNTTPLSAHLADTNPEFQRLEAQLEVVEHNLMTLREEFDRARYQATARSDELDEILRATRDITEDDPRYAALQEQLQARQAKVDEAITARDAISTQQIDDLEAQSQALQAHMAKVEAEERKVMLATGNIPPGIHGMEHLLSGQGHESWEFRAKLTEMLAYMESAETHRYQLSKARNDRTRAIYMESLASDEQMLQATWAAMRDFAANAGAVIRPEDLDRVLPHFKFQYHDLRYSALLGKDEPGARIRNGIDPLGHQVNVYIHPEGLQRPGTDIHPGGTATGILGWAYSSERNLVNGETIRFIDEGQSDHVKARAGADRAFQYLKTLMAEGDPAGLLYGSDMARALIKNAETYDDWVWNKYRLAKIEAGKSETARNRITNRLPEKWADVTPEQKVVMRRDPIFADYNFTDGGMGVGSLVAIPQQVFAPTAQFNIFKSEMFNAAREGKQWFGWTTTEVAQGRYPAESAQHIENPEFAVVATRNKITMEGHDAHGRRMGRQEISFEVARELADRLGDKGSELHKFIDQAHQAYLTQNEIHATLPPNNLYVHTDKPVMWDAGSFHDYNNKVLKEMNKYLKRFGAKVELVDMPTAPGSPTIVKVWGVRLAGAGGIGAALLASGVAIGAPREKQ